MSPAIPLAGVLVFLAATFAHILHWRINKPKRDVIALFVTFILFPAIAILLAFLSGVFASAWNALAVYALHFMLSGVYIASYPAAQASSPSLQILLLFRGRENSGLAPAEIIKHFEKTPLVEDRVHDLLDSRLVVKLDGGYALTSKGKLLAGFFACHRKILGLGQAGG